MPLSTEFQVRPGETTQAYNIRTKALLAARNPSEASKITPTISQSGAPTPTPMTTPEGAVQASTLSYGSPVSLPSPTAPQVQEGYQLGLEGAVEQAKTNLTETMATQRDEAIKRQEEASQRLKETLSASNPENRSTYAQEQRVSQNQLNAAETASATLEADFTSRRRIVGELETLLTEGNNLIKQKQGLPVANPVVAGLTAKAMQDVQARAGVLQAVVAGLDGNVAMAHSLIDKASTAVSSNWEDIIAYNNAVLTLVQNKELAIEGEHKAFATSQAEQAKTGLTNLQTVAQTIKLAMVNPDTARSYAEAGVSLTDTPEQISSKLSEYAYRVEVRDLSNSMASNGYTYLVPGQTPPADAEVVTVTDSERKETQYYKKVKGTGTGASIEPGDDPQLYVGLTPQTATAVRARVNAFKSEPAVQNFVTLQEGYDFASNIPDTTTNPADDQALIYALAKALDPGSVVREGEYATAQKYAQSWIKAYGSGVEQAVAGTGFLSKTARRNIKATIEQKYLSSERSYNNLFNRYSDGISTLTGRGDGKLFLNDYAVANQTLPDAETDDEKTAALDQLLGEMPNQLPAEEPTFFSIP